MPKAQIATAVTDLTTHITQFKKWLTEPSAQGPEWQEGRQERLAWYREYLAKEKIATLSSDDFAKMIKDLWAVNIWHNKDYKVKKLLDDNGLDKIRSSLESLLFGAPSIEERWDAFRETIKGLGPSSLSEILTFFDPQHYALINLKPYEVLPRIGYSIEPVDDGKSYKKAVEELEKIKELLSQNGIADADFILTDFFVAYLFYEVFKLEGRREKAPVIVPPPVTTQEHPGAHGVEDVTIGAHESAEAVLLMLGNLLGYDTYTPDASRTYNGQKLGTIATLEDLPAFAAAKIMDSVRNVDVVWLRDEWPEYFFEVEHTTGVTSGLLRIYQAHKLNTKFFIVGPSDVLKKYEKEVQKSPFNAIKSKYHFRSYEELHEMYLAASKFKSTSDKFFA